MPLKAGRQLLKIGLNWAILKALAADVVVVSRLDRLARSSLDLLSILRRVTDAGAKS